MRAKPAARLHVEPDLSEGAALRLEAEQTHYLKNVLRLEAGDAVALFNGRDGEWLGRIEGFGKGWCSLTLIERRREQRPGPDLWLVFAPIKRAHIDFLVEKATELGVAALHPVHTNRTVVERVNLDRLRANAIEAAEQSERLTLPVLHEPQDLRALLTEWPTERRLLLCDESGAAPAIGEVLRQTAAERWAVLVGPEGGFAETELDALRKLAFVSPVSLGPRVLRADTAALAALAVVQALVGDWRLPRQR
jgi:16S rRNA (uracil1498-N3)-methyltransferase